MAFDSQNDNSARFGSASWQQISPAVQAFAPYGINRSLLDTKLQETDEPELNAVPPVVTIISPAPGDLLPGESITVDVTDDEGQLQRVCLWAEFPDSEAPEVVHTGTRFSRLYADGSSRSAIANGYRYVLFRRGGWPFDSETGEGGLSLEAIAIDTWGNEAA